MIPHATLAERAYAELRQGKVTEALHIVEPVAQAGSGSPELLAAYAMVLKAQQRDEEALAINLRSVERNPTRALAERDLALTLGQLGRWEQAEAAHRRAIGKGDDSADAWMLLARALIAQQRLEEAQFALEIAVARDQAHPLVQQELSQLIWMRTADAAAAAAPLRAAAAAHPDRPELAVELARAVQAAGDPDEAQQVLGAAVARMARPSAALHTSAAENSIVRGDGRGALEHARQALTLEPNSVTAALALCDAYMNLGQADDAAALALRLYQQAPNSQFVLARLTTAWRLLGDPRYHQLCDYAEMVRPGLIDTPAGWNDLGAYLADLAAALKRLHVFRAPPYDQPLRGGARTPLDLTQVDDRAVRAFFAAVDGPIRRYMAAIGPGSDILRARSTGRYAVTNAWSDLLRPGGAVLSHVQPASWVSAMCYVEAPDDPEAPDTGSRAGWVEIGRAGIPVDPPLPPTAFVRPEPGLLVLTPSYIWHGASAFSDDHDRLMIGFDVIPT